MLIVLEFRSTMSLNGYGLLGALSHLRDRLFCFCNRYIVTWILTFFMVGNMYGWFHLWLMTLFEFPLRVCWYILLSYIFFILMGIIMLCCYFWHRVLLLKLWRFFIYIFGCFFRFFIRILFLSILRLLFLTLVWLFFTFIRFLFTLFRLLFTFFRLFFIVLNLQYTRVLHFILFRLVL